MAKKPMDVKLDHSYDGIEEFDNPLPPWWVNLFILTIIYAAGYIFYFHVQDGPSQKQEYFAEMKAAENQKMIAEAKKGQGEGFKEGETFTAFTGAAEIADGKAVFDKNCNTCHGKIGEGGIGPNLTDAYWIHGGQFNNIVGTIVNGFPEKGMISWKPILKKDEIIKVASYIASLQGSNPPNAKAPQGEMMK